MINRDYKDLLPYNKSRYIDYLDEDYEENKMGWKGISIQNKANFGHEEIASIFKGLFIDFCNKLHLIGPWIMSHDDRDMNWMINGVESLPKLYEYLSLNTSDATNKGGFLLDPDILLYHFEDIVLYPRVLGYKNIDLSYCKYPLIVKLTAHLSMDILSLRDKDIMGNVEYMICGNKNLIGKDYN